jgi:outer membrane protein, heavy metal efflux system
VTYQPHPLAPEKSAAQFAARRLDDPGLKNFIATNAPGKFAGWPLPKWNLDSLTLAAFYFHPDFAVARAQWQVAVSGLRTAGARPNPTVGFTPAYDAQIPGNYSPWLLPVNFDLPVETAGKRGKRLVEAAAAAESARWTFAAAAWQIRNGVRTSLLDFKTAGRRAELLERQFAAQTEITQCAHGRFAAGEISRPEWLTAQAALHKAQLDLLDAHARKMAARSRLAEALGVPEAALAGPSVDFVFTEAVTPLTVDEARRIALRARPDLQAALADYAAAESELQLQIAKQWPDLHLGPAYAWNSGNTGDSQWSLGLTLELPVLNQNQGPIAEAKARRSLSAAKFLQLQSQIIAQVSRAVVGWQSAQAQLKVSGEMLAAAKKQAQSVTIQFQAGAVAKADLAGAERELLTAQLAQLDSETAAQTALAALEDALQQPSENFDIVKMLSLSPDQSSQP